MLQVLAAEAESLLRRHAYIVLTARWDFLAPDEATWLHALEVPVVPKPFELSRLLEVVAQAATRLRDAEP